MKEHGRKILNVTDGGLTIFKHYLTTPFELDKETKFNGNDNFKVFWHEGYNNYVISISHENESHRFNAIWFVKWKYGLTEEQTYEKLEQEMELGDSKEAPEKKESKRSPILLDI